jgi:hypothetical protein
MAGKTTGDPWQFGRADVRVLRLVLAAALVLYPALVIAPRVIDWALGKPLRWETLVADDGPALAGPAVGGATGHYLGWTEWTIPAPTGLQWVGSLLPDLVTAVALVLGCLTLWRLLTLTWAGEPFSAAGVRQVRVLSIVVLAYAVVLPFLRLLADALVMTPVRDNLEVRFQIEVPDFAPFVIGLVMLVAAECFRQGLRLRDDVDGLV